MKYLAAVLLVACSHSSSPSPATPTPAREASLSDPVAVQIEQGKALYIERCAECHGDAGQGTKDAPAVVGDGVFPQKPRAGSKRDVEFKTAADVFAWTAKAMPGDDPGSLSTEQLLAVFAFDLTANGVKLTAPLDATQAAAIVLHP